MCFRNAVFIAVCCVEEIHCASYFCRENVQALQWSQNLFLVALYIICLHCKPIPCNENRVFPVKFFSQGNPCNENRVPATRKGVPWYANRFFPVRKTSQGKPCTGPVRDCSVFAVEHALYIHLTSATDQQGRI